MITETARTTEWVAKNKRIKFSLGGFVLYQTRVRTLMLNGIFAELSNDPSDTRLPLNTCSADVRAALVISHPIAERLPRIAFTQGLIRYAPSQYRRFRIDVGGTLEEYLDQLSAHRRTRLRKTVNRFLKAGSDQTFREYSQPHEMEEYYRLARQVSSTTYQENLVDAGLPESKEFFDELVERAHRNAVRGYILFHNGQPVAYQYCPAEGDWLLYERVGYNPEFRNLNPGTVLLYLVIERLFAAGTFKKFDFGPGEFDYKETFGTGHTRCADIYFYRRTMKNVALILAHSAVDGVWAGIGAALDRAGLKGKLKRAVRSRYGQR
jgi:CelD/BcsL family acetyltransferase involved in cellulose biosynthesis